MDSAALDYDLPDTAIAQQPAEPRDAARLLVDRGPACPPEHRRVADLPELLQAGDVLVVNDTRVRRARLVLRKPTGGAVEVLLVEPRGDAWEALVRPSRKVASGTLLTGPSGLEVVVRDDLGEGRRLVEIVAGDPETAGQLPVPPYIRTELGDPDRYQTVYARDLGSAAAPTAGLHLTDDVLARCADRGVDVRRLELRIGLDTFRPIVTDRVEDHPMHTESYAVPRATMDACGNAVRVVAVGTTAVRALEAAAATGRLSGSTDLFIRRGYEFRVVDALLTNFHVPRTTLLALIDAFVGERWRALYATALAEGYRFLSFGDAMFLERARVA